jgi:hypothetical protein
MWILVVSDSNEMLGRMSHEWVIIDTGARGTEGVTQI